MRNFHVVLSDGSERNITARHFAISEGVLEFWGELSVEATESDAEIIVAYAPDSWSAVEVERKDDKGYPGDQPSHPLRPGQGPQPKK